jgi:hypothetical protein
LDQACRYHHRGVRQKTDNQASPFTAFGAFQGGKTAGCHPGACKNERSTGILGKLEFTNKDIFHEKHYF